MAQFSEKPSLRKRLNISRIAIAYPWITIAIWIIITVSGLFAYSSLKYALFPDVTFPVVVVNAKAALDTPLEIETQLAKPIETAVKDLEGLDEIYSTSYPGQTVVNLFFYPGTKLETAFNQVENILGNLTLPDDTTIDSFPYNLNESAAVSYAVKGEGKELREIKEITETNIIPVLERIPGVLRVNLLGDGFLDDADSDQDFPSLVRFNGEEVLAFQVIKTGDANTLEIVDQVATEVNLLQQQLPEIELTVAETQADYIKEAIQATIDSLILAIILAILVIFPFLKNWKATIITALAIPISLLGTCIVMAIAGFNLETITLLALALVIGIIVDDAIVDVENISRHIEAGEKPRQAAISATDEIGLTVSASTLTIVAVFLPVAFMGGTIGQFFKPFALTVSVSVLISLLVARTLSPVLASYWLKPNPKKSTENKPISQPNYIIKKYQNLLHWSLNHRKIVVGIAMLSFVAGVALIPLLPQGFIPKLDRGELNVVYTTPLPRISRITRPQPTPEEGGETDNSFGWLTGLAASPNRILLRRTLQTGIEIEQNILANSEVESVFSVIGLRGEPNKGKLYVKLREDREKNTAEIQDQIRDNLPELRRVKVSVEDLKFVDTGGEGEKPLKFALLGEDLTLLRETAQQIQAAMEQQAGLVEITITGDDSELRIERLKGQRVVYIAANLSQNYALGDVTNKVVAIANSLLPNGVTLNLEGDSALSASVIKSFGGTLTLSVISMLAVLLFVFGRLLEPIVVGLSLPLSIVGAMLALLITQNQFGMISVIGIIFLLGLLDKNALLLMDYANQLREKGMNRMDAIIETGAVRLRPIIMTTASTILGMMPLALGLGAGAELRQPMAVAIIGGLITSSLLSLIIVPVFYSLLEDLWRKLFKNH
jgi:multidrug efflux pump subunit AcrB